MTLIGLALAVMWTGALIAAPLDGRRRRVAGLAVAVLVLALLAVAFLAAGAWRGTQTGGVMGGWPVDVGIHVRADGLGVVFAAVTLVALLAGLLHEIAAGIASRTMPALILFMAVGLTGLFLTADVFSFYVFFELSMIAAYALAAYGGQARQEGAALIFAVVNLLGSFLFLIAIGSLYRVTGTLEFDAVAERFSAVEPTAAILIAVAFFVAFGVKLGLFPFHFWLPAVYGSVRPSVAAMLAGGLANIGAYGLIRFASLMPRELDLAANAVVAVGVASIAYGSLQALSRRTAREVLAYSAIGQAGFVLIALGIGGPAGWTAAVVFAIANSLNKAVLFLACEIRGRFVGGVFFLGALSVAGIPPTAGFFGKAAVFGAGVEAANPALLALLVAGGALSLVYLLQIHQHAFWRDERELTAPARGAIQAPTVVLAAAVLVLGVWPEPLLAAADVAAQDVGAPR